MTAWVMKFKEKEAGGSGEIISFCLIHPFVTVHNNFVVFFSQT